MHRAATAPARRRTGRASPRLPRHRACHAVPGTASRSRSARGRHLGGRRNYTPGKRDLALIALDRETARRVRALLERMDVLVADETGWTLSTTAVAAVIDRWLECVRGDFPARRIARPAEVALPAGRTCRAAGSGAATRTRAAAPGRRAGHDRHPAAGADRVWRTAAVVGRAVWRQTKLCAEPRAAGRLAHPAERQPHRSSMPPRRSRPTPLAPTCSTRWKPCATTWPTTAKNTASANGGAGSIWRWSPPASSTTASPAPVVLTSLPAARGRVFEAVAVIGADARHLPARPAPGLFSQATRAQLGLPTAQRRSRSRHHRPDAPADARARR